MARAQTTATDEAYRPRFTSHGAFICRQVVAEAIGSTFLTAKGRSVIEVRWEL